MWTNSIIGDAHRSVSPDQYALSKYPELTSISQVRMPELHSREEQVEMPVVWAAFKVRQKRRERIIGDCEKCSLLVPHICDYKAQ